MFYFWGGKLGLCNIFLLNDSHPRWSVPSSQSIFQIRGAYAGGALPNSNVPNAYMRIRYKNVNYKIPMWNMMICKSIKILFYFNQYFLKKISNFAVNLFGCVSSHPACTGPNCDTGLNCGPCWVAHLDLNGPAVTMNEI